MKSDHRSKFPTFKQLEGRSLKNIRASTGFELVASAITGAMLDQLRCEARHLERGQFLEFISSRAVKWCEMCMKYKYAVQICLSYTFHTVIPKNEGLQPLKYFFNQRLIKKPSLEAVTRSGWTASHTELFFYLVTTTTKTNQRCCNGLHRKQIFLQLPRTKSWSL